MKNRSLDAVKSKVKVAVRGKNVNRYILRLARNHVALLQIQKLSKEECYITIYYKDYEKIQKLNTIYELVVVEYGGFLKGRDHLFKNKFLLVALGISLVVLWILSNMIFHIEIVTNNQKMKDMLLGELKEYQIDIFHFQKSYSQLQQIKEEILNRHHDEIEWLEIESIGTSYRIRFEPRVVKQEEETSGYRHIVAKKNAIIQKVESSSGQILKNTNDYVKKGDIIVSGYISLNDSIKNTVSAIGTVYGETWYEVDVFYPFGYYEQTRTGQKKTVYVLEFLTHSLELFNFHPFYDKIKTREVVLEKRGFPLRLVKEKQIEVHTISSIQTVEEAKERATNLAISKIQNTLDEQEKILNYRVIKEQVQKDGVRLTIFFSVYEDITDYEAITLYREEENEKDRS